LHVGQAGSQLELSGTSVASHTQHIQELPMYKVSQKSKPLLILQQTIPKYANEAVFVRFECNAQHVVPHKHVIF